MTWRERAEYGMYALLAYSVAVTFFLLFSTFESSLSVSSAVPPPSSSIGNTQLLQLLNDESNVRIPRHADGTPMSDAERLRLMELKVGGFTNWAKNPRFATQVVLWSLTNSMFVYIIIVALVLELYNFVLVSVLLVHK